MYFYISYKSQGYPIILEFVFSFWDTEDQKGILSLFPKC